MSDFQKALNDIDAGVGDLNELTALIVNKVQTAQKRDPRQAAALLKTITYAAGILIPTIVEEQSYKDMHISLIESISDGLQTGMKAVGSTTRMQMFVHKI